MKRPKQHTLPRVESLENIALLSTIHGLHGVAAAAHVQAAAIPGTAAATGLGSVGTVGVSDALALQQDSSGGALEQFISQLEAVYGRRANVRAYARSVITDHQVTNFDLQNVAGVSGVSLPPGVALPTDVGEFKQVLDAAKGGNLDKTYLQVMAQVNAQDVANDQQLIGSSPSTLVRVYAQETMAYDMNHLQGAQQLTRSSKSTYTPANPTTSIIGLFAPTTTTAISASDAQALQQDQSGGYLEQFISQIEAQHGRRSDAQQYAQSVVGDHQVTNFDLMKTANLSNTVLPAGITQASDIQDARQVIAAARGGNLDKTYLQVMARINAQDVASDQQLINTTQDPAVRAYALETLAYDMTHVQGAQQLLQKQGTTYTPGG